jgi:periplasmic copper chaperone A
MHKIKLLFLLIGFFYSCLTFADENINLSDVWISEAPPTVSVLAAYAKIQNNSPTAKTLTSVTSPNFSSVELHLSKVVNDMAIMEKQDTLIIPSESSIELSPGTYHLMLFNPKVALKAGDKTSINFTFADGTLSSAEAEVRKRNHDGHEHHHHNH